MAGLGDNVNNDPLVEHGILRPEQLTRGLLIPLKTPPNGMDMELIDRAIALGALRFLVLYGPPSEWCSHTKKKGVGAWVEIARQACRKWTSTGCAFRIPFFSAAIHPDAEPGTVGGSEVTSNMRHFIYQAGYASGGSTPMALLEAIAAALGREGPQTRSRNEWASQFAAPGCFDTDNSRQLEVLIENEIATPADFAGETVGWREFNEEDETSVVPACLAFLSGNGPGVNHQERWRELARQLMRLYHRQSPKLEIPHLTSCLSDIEASVDDALDSVQGNVDIDLMKNLLRAYLGPYHIRYGKSMPDPETHLSEAADMFMIAW